jgi:hypothetical protein
VSADGRDFPTIGGSLTPEVDGLFFAGFVGATERHAPAFPSKSVHGICCDPPAYRRLLRSHLGRPRRGVLHPTTEPSVGAVGGLCGPGAPVASSAPVASR